MARLERDYQAGLVKRLRRKYPFPDAYVMKTDPNQIQGIPDILVLVHGQYAMLEVKRGGKSSHRPNQDYHVDNINSHGGFASFIDPSNEDAVLSAMDEYFNKEWS